MKADIKLISGGVYQTGLSDDPCRIIAFDEIEVFYDAYWSSLGEWTFSSSPRSRGYYYRTPPKFFLKDAIMLREEPLTINELKVFRPDLPFRLCRNKQINWTGELFPEMLIFSDELNRMGLNISNEIVLPVLQITLQPYGPQGGAMKSTLVTSLSAEGFSFIELLWLAHNIQAPYLRGNQEKGVDVFRSGHEKDIPAYYIGGFYDSANFIPKEE